MVVCAMYNMGPMLRQDNCWPIFECSNTRRLRFSRLLAQVKNQTQMCTRPPLSHDGNEGMETEFGVCRRLSHNTTIFTKRTPQEEQ